MGGGRVDDSVYQLISLVVEQTQQVVSTQSLLGLFCFSLSLYRSHTPLMPCIRQILVPNIGLPQAVGRVGEGNTGPLARLDVQLRSALALGPGPWDKKGVWALVSGRV